MAKGEILIHGDGDLDQPVRISDIPPAIMQAIYHEATQKTEKISKPYYDNYVFSADDIYHLFNLIIQTQQQYDIKTSTVSIIVDHAKGEQIKYTSLAKFKEYSTSRTTAIDNINIVWKFLLSVPIVKDYAGEKKYHEYQVRVKLDSWVIPSKDDPEYDVMRAALSDGYFTFPGASVAVDYVDYVVARSFISVVDEWVKTLSIRSSENWVIPILKKRGAITQLTPILILALSTLTWVPLWNILSANKIEPILPSWITTIALTSTVSYLAAFFICFYTFTGISAFRSHPIILINKGDEKNRQHLDDCIRRGPRKIITGGLGLLTQIIVNIFAGAVIANIITP